MSRYILVMNSGREQTVETVENLILRWKDAINDNGDKVFLFNSGTIVNLLEIAIIIPHRNILPPPPPSSLKPRAVKEGLFQFTKRGDCVR